MRTVLLKPIFDCLLISFAIAGSLHADDWDPNDDTFDPNIKSVVIGDRSWIGDPSPFVLAELTRTGYTHVQRAHWEGFPPSIQISLIVPTEIGETKPPASGMLMFDKAQTVEVIKIFKNALKEENQKDQPKRVPIQTSLKQADWTLVVLMEKGQRVIQLENKSKDRVDKYRFSNNATKKLLGAVEHSFKGIDSKVKK